MCVCVCVVCGGVIRVKCVYVVFVCGFMCVGSMCVVCICVIHVMCVCTESISGACMVCLWCMYSVYM